MNHTLFLVLAYIFIWIVLFGYILNLLKKQNRLAREVALLQSKISEK